MENKIASCTELIRGLLDWPMLHRTARNAVEAAGYSMAEFRAARQLAGVMSLSAGNSGRFWWLPSEEDLR